MQGFESKCLYALPVWSFRLWEMLQQSVPVSDPCPLLLGEPKSSPYP